MMVDPGGDFGGRVSQARLHLLPPGGPGGAPGAGLPEPGGGGGRPLPAIPHGAAIAAGAVSTTPLGHSTWAAEIKNDIHIHVYITMCVYSISIHIIYVSYSNKHISYLDLYSLIAAYLCHFVCSWDLTRAGAKYIYVYTRIYIYIDVCLFYLISHSFV